MKIKDCNYYKLMCVVCDSKIADNDCECKHCLYTQGKIQANDLWLNHLQNHLHFEDAVSYKIYLLSVKDIDKYVLKTYRENMDNTNGFKILYPSLAYNYVNGMISIIQQRIVDEDATNEHLEYRFKMLKILSMIQTNIEK